VIWFIFSLKHVYTSPGVYQVHLRYSGSALPLAASFVIVEESLEDLQLVGPTVISFVRLYIVLKN